MILRNTFIVVLIVVLFTGCAVQNKQVDVSKIPPQKIYNTYKKVETKPSDLQDLYVSYYLDSEINQVLNLMHLGLYAYQKEHYSDAEQVFDKVLLNIESIYGEDKHAEDAKSLWYGEDSKRFIGEPYERALAYYYRGLLYLKNNDYENARASFKGGWLQDARSKSEQFQSDFNIFLILDALSSKLNGDENLFLSSLEEMKRHKRFNENVTIRHETISENITLHNEEEIETVNLDTPIESIEINKDTPLKKGISRLDVIEIYKNQISYYDRDKIKLKDGSVIYYNSTYGVTGWEDHGLIGLSKVTNKSKKLTQNYKYKINTKSLSIRSKPSLSAKKIGNYKLDDYVTVTEKTNKWLKTSKGWIFSKFAKLVTDKKIKATKKEEKLYQSEIFEVKTKNINIRELPNTTSKILAKLKKYDLVESVNETSNWIQTDQGWAFKNLLVKKELKENEYFHNGSIHQKFTYKSLIDGINNANLFLIIDTGSAPTKYTAGDYDSELRFRKGSNFTTPIVTIKNQKIQTQLVDNIHFQASTRGGREIDKIIDGKVAWKDEATQNAEELKETSKSSFKAATTILDTWNDARPNYNYGSGGNEADAIVGGVVLLFTAIAATAAVAGEISESAAQSVVTKADARHWQNIPGGIYLYMDKLTPGNYEITLNGTSKKDLKITIPEDGIVVEHVIDQKINKPSLLISDYNLKNIIENEDQYLEKYSQQNN